MRTASAALLAFLLGLVIFPAAVWLYLRFGNPPVAVADKPFPMEQSLAMHAVHRRTAADAPQTSPIGSSPETLLAGAHIYTQHCAMCHGTPGQPAPMHTMEYPQPPGLWTKHPNGVVGVSDDPAGETFWVVENGIRLSGMPAYKVASPTPRCGRSPSSSPPPTSPSPAPSPRPSPPRPATSRRLPHPARPAHP